MVEFLKRVAEKPAESKSKKDERTSAEKTLEMILEEASLEEIADARGVKQETIVSHLEDLIRDGNELDLEYMKKEFAYGELDRILEVFQELETTTLSPVYNYLAKKKKKPTYLKLRLARLFL